MLLVTSVSTVDDKRVRYVSALWEGDPTGERPARRLTRSRKGESGAAFTAAGDLLFTSARPDPDGAEADDAPSALWLLPADGAEARVVARGAGCGQREGRRVHRGVSGGPPPVRVTGVSRNSCSAARPTTGGR